MGVSMSKTEKNIKVDKLSIRNNEIHCRLSCSKRIKRYFNSDSFYVRYDKDIQWGAPLLVYN